MFIRIVLNSVSQLDEVHTDLMQLICSVQGHSCYAAAPFQLMFLRAEQTRACCAASPAH